MCKCCFSTSTGRVYTSDFEPITNPKFDDTFEKNLSSVRQVKGEQELTLHVQLSPCSTLQQGGLGMGLGFVLWIHTLTPVWVYFRCFFIIDTGNNFFSVKEQNCKCSEIRQWHRHGLTCRSLWVSNLTSMHPWCPVPHPFAEGWHWGKGKSLCGLLGL